MILVWMLWAALGIVLIGLTMYRVSIVRFQEEELFLDDSQKVRESEQAERLRKLKRVEPVIRIFGGVEGIVTLGIVGFYLLDALHHF
ncbi:MAG TPA: hypothetical protein VFN53_03535 [Acidobacteriaceae bacterium]|nr:hypothetical protein [Acidobacteriaceae bacterium]